jgi:hypothetical protein
MLNTLPERSRGVGVLNCYYGTKAPPVRGSSNAQITKRSSGPLGENGGILRCRDAMESKATLGEKLH